MRVCEGMSSLSLVAIHKILIMTLKVLLMENVCEGEKFMCMQFLFAHSLYDVVW